MPNDAADLSSAFRDSARALLAVHGQPARLRRCRDSQPGFERAVWRALAEAGWPAILVPEARDVYKRQAPASVRR